MPRSPQLVASCLTFAPEIALARTAAPPSISAAADVLVLGRRGDESGTLIQTLLREELVDRMHVWTHPVTIGPGKRLFANGTLSATWKLVKSRVGDAGVIIATYEPAGELVTGTIGA